MRDEPLGVLHTNFGRELCLVLMVCLSICVFAPQYVLAEYKDGLWCLTDQSYCTRVNVDAFGNPIDCWATHTHVCPSGEICDDSRSTPSDPCVSSAGSSTCSDTDGAVDPDVRGTCTDSHGSHTDSCPTNDAITEWYCYEGSCKSIVLSCDDSCSSGKCISGSSGGQTCAQVCGGVSNALCSTYSGASYTYGGYYYENAYSTSGNADCEAYYGHTAPYCFCKSSGGGQTSCSITATASKSSYCAGDDYDLTLSSYCGSVRTTPTRLGIYDSYGGITNTYYPSSSVFDLTGTFWGAGTRNFQITAYYSDGRTAFLSLPVSVVDCGSGGGSSTCTITASTTKSFYCEGDDFDMTLTFRCGGVLTTPRSVALYNDKWDYWSYFEEDELDSVVPIWGGTYTGSGTRNYEIKAYFSNGQTETLTYPIRVYSSDSSKCDGDNNDDEECTFKIYVEDEDGDNLDADKIYVDGDVEDEDDNYCSVEVDAGDHTIRATKLGYDSDSKTVECEDGDTETITLTLEKEGNNNDDECSMTCKGVVYSCPDDSCSVSLVCGEDVFVCQGPCECDGTTCECYSDECEENKRNDDPDDCPKTSCGKLDEDDLPCMCGDELIDNDELLYCCAKEDAAFSDEDDCDEVCDDDNNEETDLELTCPEECVEGGTCACSIEGCESGIIFKTNTKGDPLEPLGTCLNRYIGCLLDGGKSCGDVEDCFATLPAEISSDPQTHAFQINPDMDEDGVITVSASCLEEGNMGNVKETIDVDR